MSYLFGLDEEEKRQQLQTLTAEWDGRNEFEADATEGAAYGTGMGIMRGGAKVARAIGMAGATVPIAYDAIAGGTDAQEWYFENVVDEVGSDAVDYWTPNANEVGMVGNVLGGLGEIALPLMAGGGNPSLLAGSTQLDTGTNLVRQGVDAETAAAVGGIAGGATALGAWLPFFGSNLGQRVALNAVTNAGLGMAERGAEGAVLAGAGYDELASQYDPFDLQASAVDVLTGAAFGALYRGDAPDLPSAVFGEKLARQLEQTTSSVLDSVAQGMKPSDLDAAFAARNIKQFQIDSAPGRPLDTDSWNAHSLAQETAIRQMINGEPVDVAGIVDGATFQRRPSEDAGALDDWLKDLDDGDVPTRQIEPQILREPAEVVDVVSRPAVDEADPDVSALQQHIADHGDFDVRIAVAADNGEASVTRPASQLLAEADDVIAEADTMSKAIRAAANCFLGRGE